MKSLAPQPVLALMLASTCSTACAAVATAPATPSTPAQAPLTAEATPAAAPPPPAEEASAPDDQPRSHDHPVEVVSAAGFILGLTMAIGGGGGFYVAAQDWKEEGQHRAAPLSREIGTYACTNPPTSRAGAPP